MINNEDIFLSAERMRLDILSKNFKTKSRNAFLNAKATESIMAKADEIKVISSDLIDAYSDNNEDVSHIDDLLESMRENGFTDPIEVTNYGCSNGRYMILSGHRRFKAWTTLHDGKQPVKCIVVDASKFKTEEDEKCIGSNYVFLMCFLSAYIVIFDFILSFIPWYVEIKSYNSIIEIIDKETIKNYKKIKI